LIHRFHHTFFDCRICGSNSNSNGNTMICSRSTALRLKCFSRPTVRTVHDGRDHWKKEGVNAFVGHSFPDFIEGWNRDKFKKVGYGMGATTLALGAGAVAVTPALIVPAVLLGALIAGYWVVGLNDINQTSHAVRRNYPVLGNIRYILETVSYSVLGTG
jgi:hypothetical protein